MYHTVWQLKGEWYAWSWPHPPPSLHGTRGSNYKLEWFLTRLIYSQQQEVTKQSFRLQLLFSNITREKWQFVGMTQDRRKAGSILHCYPRNLPHISLLQQNLHQHEAKQHKALASSGPGAAPCSSQLPPSPTPCHTMAEFQVSNTSQLQHTSRL